MRVPNSKAGRLLSISSGCDKRLTSHRRLPTPCPNWKVGLSIALSVAGFAVAVPDVQAFVLARPDVTAGIVALASFFGALEKKVSAIKPVIAEPK